MSVAEQPLELKGYRRERGFLWPDHDRECARVVFGETHKLDLVYAHCRDRRVVIQAGGNCGVYPKLLSHAFDAVYTFEPEPRNFVALTVNTADCPNVVRFQAALGDVRDLVSVSDEPKNCGAGYVCGPGNIPVLRMDDLAVVCCDLIYLDIEGFELNALRGGRSIIEKHKPVIAIEDKGLSEKYGIAQGEAVSWLVGGFGYRVVDRPQRDVILVPNITE